MRSQLGNRLNSLITRGIQGASTVCKTAISIATFWVGMAGIATAEPATIPAGGGLAPNGRVESKDGRFFIEMQADCNLVIYKRGGPRPTGGIAIYPIWQSHTAGTGSGCHADMQTDGNLVIYDGSHARRWDSGTQNHGGVSAVMQDDGNLVLMQGGSPLSSTQSQVPEPSGYTSLKLNVGSIYSGEYLDGRDNASIKAGPMTLTMQNDCNLVGTKIENSGVANVVFNIQTARVDPDCKLYLQSDGNLVVYDGYGRVVWTSHTDNKNTKVAALRILPNLNVAFDISDPANPFWSTQSNRCSDTSHCFDYTHTLRVFLGRPGDQFVYVGGNGFTHAAVVTTTINYFDKVQGQAVTLNIKSNTDGNGSFVFKSDYCKYVDPKKSRDIHVVTQDAGAASNNVTVTCYPPS